ncbi:MAG: glutamate 5-kinase, partial [Deltaproteobacteria bacterium]|nr:glutamate 5-kinase [Deltaproteobacteria bacterium]
MNRAEVIRDSQRVVVKVGSGVLTGPHGLDIARVADLAGQIARLCSGGRQVVLVSSGAISSGAAHLRPGFAPSSIPEKQAAAAMGQARLVQAYEDAFAPHGIKVAQVLLTGGDLRRRKRYLNARNTLITLLSWEVLPIINENDTVAVAEIKLGDND